MVDYVIPFDEINPLNLIKLLAPDVLVKGADYKINEIIGSEFVRSYGGDVFTIDYLEEYSSTKIIDKIIHLNKK